MVDQDISKKLSTDKPSAILAMVLFSNPAAVTGTIAPAIVFDFTERFHILPQRVSTLVSAELAGITLALVLGSLCITMFDRRVLGLMAVVVAIAGQIGTLLVSSFALLLLARMAAGFGAGMAFSVAMAAIAGTRHADRNFSFSVTSNTIVSTVILAVVAYFNLGVPAGRTMIAFTVLWILTAITAPWLGKGNTRPAPGLVLTEVVARFSRRSASLGLLGIFLISAGFGAVWPSVGQIGLERGEAHSTIAAAFAVVGFGGIVAGFGAAWVSGRLPRRLLVALGAFGFAAGVSLLIFPLPFMLVTLLIMFFWVFGLPFYYGTMASLDPSGRLTILTGAMLPSGIAVGQLITAALAVVPGFHWILASSVALTVFGWVALQLAASPVQVKMLKPSVAP